MPWFNKGIKQARKERRRTGKKWRLTGSVSDFWEFKSKRNYTTYLMNTARREFFKEFIDKNSSKPKDLFTAKKLLKHDHDVLFPPSDNKLTLANEMGTFFIDKIRTIHAKLDKLTSALSGVSSDDTESWSGALMDHFKPLSEGDVCKLIEGFPKKSCTLDPMTTSLVIKCIDVLLPVITKIINLSLESGSFA